MSTPSPLFHVNGLFMQLYATLIAGASAVVRGHFSASEWLADIRRSRATVTNTLGAMTAFIFAEPETTEDRDHCLRIIQAAPTRPRRTAFGGSASALPRYFPASA